MIQNIQTILNAINGLIIETYKFLGLGDSNIAKQTKVVVRGNEVAIVAPDYIYYVDKGRKAGRRPPIRKIIEWVKKNNFRLPDGVSLDSIAYAVATSISKKGVRGKNFLDTLRLKVTKIINDYAENQANNIIKIIIG